jgi:hypothetical protein
LGKQEADLVYFENWMGLIVLGGSSLLMVLTVPWKEIQRFLLFGVFGGLMIGIVLIFILQNRLGLWNFHRIDLIYLGRIPLLLSAAWTPTEIFFAYFLSRCQHFWPRLTLLLFIPGVATAIHFIQIWNRMLIYRHWSLTNTFLLSLVIHVGLAYYLHKVHQIPLLE